MVHKLGATAVHRDVMPAWFIGKSLRLREFSFDYTLFEVADADSEKVVFDRGDLSRCVVEPLSVVSYILNVGLYVCYPADIACIVAEVQISEAVPVGSTIDENVLLSLYKVQWIKGFYIFIIVFAQDDPTLPIFTFQAAVSVEGAEQTVSLAPIQKLGIEDRPIRGPAYIGDVGFLRAGPSGFFRDAFMVYG